MRSIRRRIAPKISKPAKIRRVTRGLSPKSLEEAIIIHFFENGQLAADSGRSRHKCLHSIPEIALFVEWICYSNDREFDPGCFLYTGDAK